MSDIAAVGEKRVFESFDKEAFKKEILRLTAVLFVINTVCSSSRS